MNSIDIIGKKCLFLLLAAITLFTSIRGCQSMAIQMSSGEKLYRAKCSSCHNIIGPDRHDEETWRKYVNDYGEKMTIEEKQLVLRYLAGSD